MLLVFCRHLVFYHSVTMPALLLRSAQQSTRHKSQNHMKAIYRSHLKFVLFFNTTIKMNKNPYFCTNIVHETTRKYILGIIDYWKYP